MAMQTPQTMASLASILRQASRDFIFSNPEFVARVLNSAAPLGQDCIDRLASAMHGAVSSGALQRKHRVSPSLMTWSRGTRRGDVAARLHRDRWSKSSIEHWNDRLKEQMKWQADRTHSSSTAVTGRTS